MMVPFAVVCPFIFGKSRDQYQAMKSLCVRVCVLYVGVCLLACMYYSGTSLLRTFWDPEILAIFCCNIEVFLLQK